MELQTISYDQIISGFEPEGDKYGIAAYALSEPRKTAFLSNPSLVDKTKAMLLLVTDNEKIVGRCMNLPSRLKVGDRIIDTVGGSALVVAADYRTSDAGIMLMGYNMQVKEYDATVASGFSRVAVKCHKALGSYILKFPQFIHIRDFKSYLLHTRLPYWTAILAGFIINILSLPIGFIFKRMYKEITQKYVVTQVDTVPEWVNSIVMKDGHKYMEVHDQQWLQWNLDNMFHAHKDNVNKFFTVSRNGENLGFFMIKERHEYLRNRKDSIVGTIVEWGTEDQKVLSEYDLQMMAFSCFSRKVGCIYLATDDNNVKEKLKKPFFYREGDAEVAFKDLSKQFKDAKNEALWRLRLGYADTILG